jgi:deoxyribonuclease-4
MPILGAHMSIAGGFDKAVERAHVAGCDCVQIFSKNNNQWRARPIPDGAADQFQQRLQELNITHPLIHTSYLINLGSPEEGQWQRSVEALVIEIRRADELKIPFVVVHPGAFTSSDEASGIRQIALGLDELHRQTAGLESRVLLETTAGQGTNLGWQFEQLAAMFDQVKDPDRIGICVDTCHVHAAGYALSSPEDYDQTWKSFEAVLSIDQIHAIHLNDSKRELGSRVDRHEHIGQGDIGLEAFRMLMNDSRFSEIPMYLETPKQDPAGGEEGDQLNLQTLRNLIQ